MIRKISVTIRADEDAEEGSVRETLQIVTKHETFKIPITGDIHLFENFDNAHEQKMQSTGKPL
jgi:hypothetical protein